MPACLSPADPPFRLDTARLDQHLTVTPAVITELIGAAALRRNDTVLDIGAGTGLITRAIAACVGATIAIEIERRFEPFLRPLHETYGISIRWTDFRKIAPTQTTAVVANPPFGATEHLVDWLTRLPQLRSAALIVGRRFARAAIAIPGTEAYTRLSLHLQAAFTAQLCATVAPTDFYPIARRPAAIITLTPAITNPLVRAIDVAFTSNAGIRVHELLLDLHYRELLGDRLPVLRDALRGHLCKRLQQLTNGELSRTVHVLSPSV